MVNVKYRGLNSSLTIKKIFCLGRNYEEHAREMNAKVPSSPVIFLKPATAIIQNGAPIVRPAISNLLHHEVELYVAIGMGGKNIPSRESYRHIAGYGVALDMTLRDLQNEAKKSGSPWSIAKAFDTSAPVSEIIPVDQISDPHALTLRCLVNGSERQRASTGKMIFRVDQIIEFISKIFTIEEGDLIFTGTPEGVGEVKPGDIIQAELVGFTSITHPVQAA